MFLASNVLTHSAAGNPLSLPNYPQRFSFSLPLRVQISSAVSKNDEWQLQRRYMQLEGLQTLTDNQSARLSAVVS